MFKIFDDYYQRGVFLGLIVAIWFCAFARLAHDLWAASLFFFWVSLLSFIFCVGRCRDKTPLKLPMLLPALLLILSSFLSAFASYDVSSTLSATWTQLFMFLSFYLFTNVVQTARDRESFFALSGVVILPLAAICLYEQWTGRPDPYGYGYWEIHATLINSIVMAGFCLPWIFFYGTKMLKRPRYILLFIGGVIVLGIARSWWAYFSLLAGLLYYFKNRLSEVFACYKMTAMITAVICSAGLIMIILLRIQVHRYPYIGSGRLFYWMSALNLWRHHAWTGVGLGAYATAYPYFKTGPIQSTLFAHSFPLQILAETGSLGFCVAIYFVIRYVSLLSKNIKSPQSSDDQQLYKAILICLVCFSLVNINMEYLLNRLIFLFILGSTLINHPIPAYRIKPLWIMTGGICLVLVMPLWLSFFEASRLYAAGIQYEKTGDLSRARKLYLDAISLDRFNGDSYRAISRIDWKTYQQTHDRRALVNTLYYFRQAMRYKKEVAPLPQLSHP